MSPNHNQDNQDRTGWRTASQDWEATIFGADPAMDDEHYVPPEPPPLPQVRRSTVIAVLVIVSGLLILLAPALFGLTSTLAVPAGITALIVGLGVLLFRVGPERSDTDPDDGARV